MANRLEGKTALITGGTSGIGLATARLFHDEGACVLVTGSNPVTIDAARRALSGVAEVLQSDAGDAEQIEHLFAHIKRELDGLDVLFLNAGIATTGLITELDIAKFDEVFRINVRGPWLALRAAIPVMRHGSAIVLNGSINGILGMPGTSAYAASKAALRSFGRTAAAELVERGIRVNVVSPGPTDTGIIDKSVPQGMAEHFKTMLVDRIPQRRLGRSEEIAHAVLFLASADSSFMTGEEIVVDGGMTRL